MDKDRINFKEESEEKYSIDLLQFVKKLWSKIWLIGICGVLAAIIGFSVAAFIIPNKYSSNVKLYVNNSAFSLGGTSFSISASELTAAQSLVKTYGEILNSRSTLELVIDKAGVDYTWKELSKMIEYAPSNGTEIMKVTVTSTDPYEASKIANTIAEVLPARITEIIDGASMEIVDTAIPDLQKISPSISKYTMLGFVVGVLLSVAFIFVTVLLDDTIHDEEYVLKTYGYPVLGRIPNLLYTGGKSYEYVASKQKKN